VKEWEVQEVQAEEAEAKVIWGAAEKAEAENAEADVSP